MTRTVLTFIAIVYGLSIALSLVVGFSGGPESDLIGFGVSAMFFPSIAVLIVMSLGAPPPSLDWSRFPMRYLPIALFLMPVVMHAAMLPMAAGFFGQLPWEDSLARQPDGLFHTPASLGWGVLSTQELIARIALNAGIGIIINSFFAFFEELGWRAWLLPRLVETMRARVAIIASASIWAFWHTPFALSGIHHLDGVPILLTAIVMPIGIAGSGLIIGWLWMRTESIWIVTLAHASMNNWGQYAFKFMSGPGRMEDGLILAAGGLALLAVGVVLVAHIDKEVIPKNSAGMLLP